MCIKTSQAISSPSKIEGAGGSMKIILKFSQTNII